MKISHFILRILFLTIFAFFFQACNDKQFDDQLPIVTNSSDVSLELVTTIAENFVSTHENPNSSGVLKRSNYELGDSSFLNFKNKKIKEIKEIKSSDGVVDLYIINFQENGFLIVSGTKKETPILAFSTSSEFQEEGSAISETGLSEWIADRKSKIEKLRKDGTYKISEKIKNQWDCIAPPEDEEIIISGGIYYEHVGPLLSTTWGQGCGYNDLLETCNSIIPNRCNRV